ncbi:MAG: hypothetical protein WC465_02605 [Patescibacteria group bacterium]
MTKTKKIKFVFWRKISGDPVDDYFSDKPQYHAFFMKCSEIFDFRIANNPDSYVGGGIFGNVYKYQNWKFVPAEKIFKADVVYQRKRLTDESFDYAVPIIDTPEFKKWCPDKWNQYQLLSRYMPKTFLVQSQEEFIKKLRHITTKKAVVKPRRGEKGENVIVFGKNNPPFLDKEILNEKGYLLQEFADTNIKVGGMINSLHDIKLITIGDKFFANLRIPEQGKEYCTYNSPYFEISKNVLPENVVNFYWEIRETINKAYPNNFYTIDMGITKKGPVLFELNSHTVFPYMHFSCANEFFDAFIKTIQLLVRN